MNWRPRFGRALWQLLSPPACVACDAPLVPDARAAAPAFCPSCEIGLSPRDPQRCATCERRANPASGLCRRCARRLAPLAGLRACFDYQGPLAEALPRLKYQRRDGLAAPLGRRWRQELEIQGQSLPPQALCLPVPLHPRRLAQRGFDQAWLLTAAVRRGGENGQRSWLRRCRHTAPQVGLGREARLRNLQGAFVADARVAHRAVVLLDDVLTTGATAQACAAALEAAGARSVVGWMLARADP